MTKKRRGKLSDFAKAHEKAMTKAALELHAKGAALLKEYYRDSGFAQAKLDAGMRFTPELVAYMEREVKNRRIAEEIRKENTADIKEESDNGDAEAATDRPGDRDIGAGHVGSAGPDDTRPAVDDAGAGDQPATDPDTGIYVIRAAKLAPE